MDYVKIPQDVRVKDKLIGPLSLMQIIVIGVGSGASYAMFAAIQKTSGSVPVVMHAVIWWPAILSVLFAVVRINNISFFRYCLLALEMFSKPRKRFWQPRSGINLVEKVSVKKVSAKNKNYSDVDPSRIKSSDIRLEDLSAILDKEDIENPQKTTVA